MARLRHRDVRVTPKTNGVLQNTLHVVGRRPICVSTRVEEDFDVPWDVAFNGMKQQGSAVGASKIRIHAFVEKCLKIGCRFVLGGILGDEGHLSARSGVGRGVERWKQWIRAVIEKADESLRTVLGHRPHQQAEASGAGGINVCSLGNEGVDLLNILRGNRVGKSDHDRILVEVTRPPEDRQWNNVRHHANDERRCDRRHEGRERSNRPEPATARKGRR